MSKKQLAGNDGGVVVLQVELQYSVFQPLCLAGFVV